jgi:branched-chain amino acid transport system ATP-binding protein
MTMLEIRGLKAYHGASQALFGVDLEVGQGEVVALLGRNGMGKTTTIRAIFGLVRAQATRIAFEGTSLHGLAPHRIARLGLGLVPEGRRCFATLSVSENLQAAARRGYWTQARVNELFPRLGERARQMARTLSGGEQQMLAIGRALMTNPKLLVLDEATEGLAPVIRRDIWSALRQLKAQGQSILVVDGTLPELLPVADSCVILEKGASVWSGRPQEFSPAIANRYLGL